MLNDYAELKDILDVDGAEDMIRKFDINGDGVVDLQDLLLVLDSYGPCEL